MAVWPGTLPHSPLADSFSYEPAPQSISTQMDSGPPKRRRRYSVAYGKFGMSFILTGTQRAAFETFYGTDLAGGSGTITGFPNPIDGSSATFQFADGGDPKWRALRPDGSANARKWLLSVVWDQVG